MYSTVQYWTVLHNKFRRITSLPFSLSHFSATLFNFSWWEGSVSIRCFHNCSPVENKKNNHKYYFPTKPLWKLSKIVIPRSLLLLKNVFLKLLSFLGYSFTNSKKSDKKAGLEKKTFTPSRLQTLLFIKTFWNDKLLLRKIYTPLDIMNELTYMAPEHGWQSNVYVYAPCLTLSSLRIQILRGTPCFT